MTLSELKRLDEFFFNNSQFLDDYLEIFRELIIDSDQHSFIEKNLTLNFLDELISFFNLMDDLLYGEDNIKKGLIAMCHDTK